MPLSAGTSLGPYRIVGPLGRGGMGEVYRAHDPRVDREVAIKVLPVELAADPDRRARFEREARMLATLEHPNVASLFGFEEAALEGRTVAFLVMQLVGGETLAERLKKGALPWREAIGVFEQIADGLKAAHERGLVHRDLKPANVKIDEEERVKVLDFGLARPVSEEPAASADGDLTRSPTLTAATAAGVLLGTAAYMSPEQARAKRVDRRADVWSFGCCLWEALTGRRPFDGEDVSLTLANVLSREPEWRALPSDLPPALRTLLERCLEKDPERRLQDVGEAKWWLARAARGDGPESGSANAGPGRGRLLVAGFATAAALLIGLVVGSLRNAPGTAEERLVAFTERPQQSIPPGTVGRELAVDSGGRFFVFTASHAGSSSALYRRDLASAETVRIEGTVDGFDPFLSPDGRWLGFANTSGELFRVPTTGGSPQLLAQFDASSPGVVSDGLSELAPRRGGRSAEFRGFAWVGDEILVGTRAGPLYRLPAVGGSPEPLAPEGGIDGGPLRGRYPQPLGADLILFDALDSDDPTSSSRLYVFDRASGTTIDLGIEGTAAQHLADGFLVWARQDGVWACPFDLERLEPLDTPVLVVKLGQDHTDRAPFAVSPGGTLVVLEPEALTLIEVGADGQQRSLGAEPGLLRHPRWSGDGRRLGYTRGGIGVAQIWVREAVGGRESRLLDHRNDVYPVWTPKGAVVFFDPLESERGARERYSLRLAPPDRSAPSIVLHRTERIPIPLSVSRDDILLFSEDRDLWWLDLTEADGERVPEARRWLETVAEERNAAFSPDGRWIAYDSDEGGRVEVYLRPFPGPGGARPVSAGGGREPVWSSDARSLYFRSGESLRAVDVTETGTTLQLGEERVVMERFPVVTYRDDRSWDLRPGTAAFVSLANLGESRLSVVLDWQLHLRQRFAVGSDPRDRR